MAKPFYVDLFSLSEDDRIAIIGKQAEHSIVSFIVEDDEKANRYIRKLLFNFKVRVVERGSGPVPDTVYVKVGPAT